MISNKKVGIIIQARMGSTRLPKKVLKHINGKPILSYQIERLKELSYPIYIATTTEAQDDPLEIFAQDHQLLIFRGDEDNVLKRYYECASQYNLDVIVRITSDCPLIDAEIISIGIKQYLEENNELLYLSNTLERTYPRGADFEVFSFLQLADAYENAVDNSDIEHVTVYIWKNKSHKTHIIQFTQTEDFSRFRLTLDTPEDFILIKTLIETYQADKLNMSQICKIMTDNPELPKINEHIEQKKT